ncbi:hypothetical protein TWF730_005106 [Orbilia blumenaviensis]|uniref:Cyanovirin-N domain-containing protein n=1 Tax=Orbilia blumenaviensis TaxID=1796055 RepID=A0AAV9VHB1_9PEZI
MVRKYSLILLASWLATAQASISSQCINLRFQNRWLVGDCLTGSGGARIESSVYLQTKIANHEGVLEWAINGNFAASCTECALSFSPLKLNCKCRPTGGPSVPASIALDEHIAVYSGFLLSDQRGPPTPPAVASTIRLPADPGWRLNYGNTSCYSENPGTCPPPAVGNGITCPPLNAVSGASVSAADGVSDCFAFRWPISIPTWQTFGSIQITSPSGAFKFHVYSTVDCSGGIKGTVEPSELGTPGVCKAFNEQLLAFKSVPLWNGQT